MNRNCTKYLVRGCKK